VPELPEPLELPEALELPELLELLEPLDILEAPVDPLTVDAVEALVPPQAARASAPMQHAALSSATRSFGKTGVR
jgi:hypothetical protein